METNHYEVVIQKRLQEVLQLGYTLTQEDLQKLFATQKQAWKAAGMIDMDRQIVFALANRFVSSPYIQITTYLAVLQECLFAYYVVRREVKQCYDDELVSLLYEAYLRHHGEFSKECILDCIQRGRGL